MHDELLATLIVWGTGVLTTGSLLWWDYRRLTPTERSCAWHRSTLYLAVSGLFLPAPLTFGAHLWVTRQGPWWRRFLLALGGSVSAVMLSMALASLVLIGLGVE